MAYQPLPFRAVAANVLLAVENGQSLTQCLPPALNQLPPEQRPQLQRFFYEDRYIF